MKRVLLFLACAVMSLVPSSGWAQDVEELADVMWYKTSYKEITPERRSAMNAMQKYADSFTHTYFKEYLNTTPGTEKEKSIEGWGLMRFYNLALEKLLKEIPETKVKKGEVVMWQLYNMGYIVKTNKQCFGIDLYHKHAERLAPMIDFMLITHKHGDHYYKSLVELLESQNKAVYSNFLDNGYKVSTGDSFTIGNISVKVTTVDHNNANLRNFVNAYEVNCYDGDGEDYVILFSGDACNYEQLNPSGKVDLFVPHLANGLNMPKTMEKINPTEVLMSHILELGHSITKARWSYEYGINKCEKLNRKGVYLPVWGEMIQLK
jgi:hypothetical protein